MKRIVARVLIIVALLLAAVNWSSVVKPATPIAANWGSGAEPTPTTWSR